MKKNIFGLLAIVMVCGTFLMEEKSEAADPTITAEIPQTITMTGEVFNKSGTAEAVWTVTSNDGVDVSFSGTSKTETGQTTDFPQFIKQDVDASGSAVVDKYDVLTTTCGVVITDYTSVEIGDTWGGGGTPTGSPQDLVKSLNAQGSPDAAIGRIVTKDDGQGNMIAKIHLYVTGSATAEDQSGNYIMTVTCTVTSNPA